MPFTLPIPLHHFASNEAKAQGKFSNKSQKTDKPKERQEDDDPWAGIPVYPSRNLKAKRGSKKTKTKKEVLGKIKKEKCKLKLKFTKLRKEINEPRKKQLLLKEKHIRAKELSANLTL